MGAIAGAVAVPGTASWRRALGDLRAVRVAVGDPSRRWDAGGGGPLGWLDPAGRLDTWLESSATPAARREAALVLSARGRWTREARTNRAIDRWLRDVAWAAGRGADAEGDRADARPPDEAERRLARGLLRTLPMDADAVVITRAWLAAAAAGRTPDARRTLAALLAAWPPPRLATPDAAAAFAGVHPRVAGLRQLALEGVATGLTEELAAIASSSEPPAAALAAALLVRLGTVDPARLAAPADPAIARLAAAASPDTVDVALAVAGDHAPALRAAVDARLAARADEAIRDRSAGPHSVPHAARIRASRPWSAVHRSIPDAATLLAAGGPDAGVRAAIAARRQAEPPPPTLPDRLLADPAVPPALAALVAGRLASPARRADVASDWIRSLDDRRKLAGAVLAALSPTPAVLDLLVVAHTGEDVPSVRTAQRLALAAAGRGPTTGPPAELLLAAAPADRRPTLALLAALGGRQDALAELTSLPDGADAATVALLEAAILRLVPHWAAAVGRPVGGGSDALRLHFDRLEARRLVESSALEFDADAHRFAPAPSAPARPVPGTGLPAKGEAAMIRP